MSKQKEFDKLYMRFATDLANTFSKAKRKKVGSCFVTKTGVLLPGYNGTPCGWCNTCEIEDDGKLITKPEVLHAELNGILKAACEGISLRGSTVYITLSPCVQCCSMLSQIGVERIVYKEEYRITDGIDLIRKYDNITVEKL